MKAPLLLALLVSVSLTGCANDKSWVKHAPSSGAIRKEISASQSSIVDAQTAAARAKQHISQLRSSQPLNPSTSQLVIALDHDVDALTKSLMEAQKHSIQSQDRIVDHDQDVQNQTDALNTAEARTQKPRSSFSFWGLASVVLQFVSNPFSFLITRAIELAAGVAGSVVVFILARFAWRRWRQHRSS